MRVGVVTMGRVPGEILPRLCAALRAQGFEGEVRSGARLPAGALDEDRGQYRADDLLAAAGDAGGERTLVVTEADLYTEGLNFVFGLATIGGSTALVSLHRLAAEDEGLFLERAVKECVHELGHTLGLGHCPDPACVMSFSDSLAEADAKGTEFCATCWAARAASGGG